MCACVKPDLQTATVPRDRVPDYSSGTKCGFVKDKYGTGDLGIRVILGLFWMMGSPGLLALSERSDP